ncbi:MAG: beta-lactamase family protein [Scytonema sp. RU_4_4]|nr:beta-lactamase family protein [Scytonema sp. RU_4_4]NJR76469.1 beta-lactamase family protein [Scytonema sp. CRU_2_7]
MSEHLAANIVVQDDLARNIDNYLVRVVPTGFAGSVLVAQDGKIVLHRSYGLANDAIALPNTPDTVFDIGSLTKQFTAVAILQLEERGLLRTTDPISQYFENVPPDKASITIHHLLTHTAGVTEHADDDHAPMTREEAIQRIFAQRLAFAPGTGYTYSNSGYTLLAAIIELVSGKIYPTYLKTHLFNKAGLQRTGFYNDPQWQTLPIAHGYLNYIDWGSPATWSGPYWTVMGNGEALSTTRDLYQWWQALQNHTILSATQTARLFEQHAQESEDSYYGYGWTIVDTDIGSLITHDGGGLGGNADLAFYPEQRLLIIILSNRMVYLPLSDDVSLAEKLYATDTSWQLARNIVSGDFSQLPRPTRSIIPALVVLGIAIVMVCAGVTIVLRRWRR